MDIESDLRLRAEQREERFWELNYEYGQQSLIFRYRLCGWIDDIEFEKYILTLC